MRKQGFCEGCNYYREDPDRGWGPPNCLIRACIAGENPGYGVVDPCPYWERRSRKDPPCYREKESGEWWCVFDHSACAWNDGGGTCLHEHPTSPAPLKTA
ncbi:hypothetical protein [Desulfovirgula thermocuniculi]|uniref:hypothetical protein n=1 Tax=Desulfovirgula thermocuniculi TaxID=348842 RepID=UPI0012EC99DA|nr:hypothetical protein [Desulfovirgula thermocuniculi]